MECKFVAGDKVVCVDAAPLPGTRWRDTDAPTEGQVYTVRRVLEDARGTIVLHLMELERAPEARAAKNDPNLGYIYTRFRPAEDIEQFRRLVAKVPSKIILEGVE